MLKEKQRNKQILNSHNTSVINQNRSKRILSSSKAGIASKKKKLATNSSQPAFEKFTQRKASYIAYMKGSRIQVNLLQDK